MSVLSGHIDSSDCWRIVTILMLLVLLVESAALADNDEIIPAESTSAPQVRTEQDRPRRRDQKKVNVDDSEKRERRRRPREDSSREPIGGGFLILDNQYISPPYVIESYAGGVRVNDIEYELESDPDLDDEEQRPRLTRLIRDALEEDAAVLGFTGEAILVLPIGYESESVLHVLAGERLEDAAQAQLIENFSHRESNVQFQTWLNEFSPPPELKSRAVSLRRHLVSTEEHRRKAYAAEQQMEYIIFVLMLLGFVGVAGAFWRLTNAQSHVAPDDESSRAVALVSRSVLVIVLLSALDLAWTLIAWKTGRMAELNPVGRRFIQDPASLSIFKSAATMIGCGLFYMLRHHRPAQVGSWWACLICAIVALRWLAFSSLIAS